MRTLAWMMTTCMIAGFFCLIMNGIQKGQQANIQPQKAAANATETNGAGAVDGHKITVTVAGTGEPDFDGCHYLDRPLTDEEKALIRGLLKLAELKGGKHSPSPPEKSSEKK